MYMSVIILCICKVFHSGVLKLFEGNFHQGIKIHIIYYSLNINIRTVIILFSIHFPSIYTHKSPSVVFAISSLNFSTLLHQ